MMFKRKKKKIGCETPQYRKSISAPPAKQPNPNYVPPSNVKSSVQKPKEQCTYSTQCGWCVKWDKKIWCEDIPNNKGFGKHTIAELVVMEELLDRYHKLFGIEKFTYKEN